ncbi:MAG: L-2-amino-thiazoline-4-carboxylic acid hydrolase [Dehalococcoidales bacterium]
MDYPIDKEYYVKRKPELLEKFEADVKLWTPLILAKYGEIQAYKIIQTAYQHFENLIPQIPYIGGDENNLTKNLIDSVRYLALYQAMKNQGYAVEEIGEIIYEGYLKKISGPQPPIPPAARLTPEQLIEQRQQGAAKSQERRYPGDYVFEFVVGNGKKFDYGYDFTECASLKLYHAQDADELLPYYCYLDFVAGQVRGFGFTRTKTLIEGHGKCNHRFKVGGVTKAPWPPPFLKRKKR